MIETIAVITRIDNGRIWIKGLDAGACGACLKQSSCGTAALAKLLPKREFAIDDGFPCQVGDEVRVAIDDSHLLFGSILLYLLPLIVMLSGIALASALLPSHLGAEWLPEISLAILLLTFWAIHRFQRLLLRFWPISPNIIGKS